MLDFEKKEKKKRKIKAIKQLNVMDCGPTCLLYLSKFHGKNENLDYLRKLCYISKNGVTLNGINEAAKEIGFSVLSGKVDFESLLLSENYFPCLLHWNENHFVLLIEILNTKKGRYFKLMDPRFGYITIPEKEFKENWLNYGNKGIVSYFEPEERFFSKKETEKNNVPSILYFFKYLKPHRKKFLSLFLLIGIGACITFILPFLTKHLIDEGVSKNNLHVVELVLIAQLSLFLGVVTINLFRNWISLFIGTHVSIQLIQDFISKLVKLPMNHFENHMIGDLNQRVIDNERIERLISSETVHIFFSIITLVVFSIVLSTFSLSILAIYITFTCVSIFWIMYWLKRRKILEFYEFQIKSRNQESIFEIFSGIRDLKLYQLEKYKLNQWKEIQNELFQINIKSLKIDQLLTTGYQFIHQLKNILVTYIAATLVIKGNITLGTLLGISFIIGEMNGPINQLINFIKKTQDAKLSLQRINEMNSISPEEREDFLNFENLNKGDNNFKIKNLSFSYSDPNVSKVLENINFEIEAGKVTAIVGHSGSGKTTLMKLLLRFYEPNSGTIEVNGHNLNEVSPKSLRNNIGTVLQDGFIFSETIARNIATHDENINSEKLNHALEMACIKTFIDTLPKKENTLIGSLGVSLSTGQKQRILIARAIYENPNFIFLDEATSALDSKTEKEIHNNLQHFFKNKTVLIIAHRLSTVKNADKIIVIDSGKIVEIGNHNSLIEKKGTYFELVQNQLELQNN